MKTSSSRWLSNVLWLMFLITFGIVAYRSATLSMTHDESATWLYIQDRNILWSLFDSGAWGTANNHYLNSVLIHFFTSIFGHDEWVIRLPNTLAYILYGISSIAIITRIFKQPGSRLLAGALIFGNVYLIDFFSQARGYGLSVAFHMTAILFFYEWVLYRKLKHLSYMFTFLSLATLSMFTHLIFVPEYAFIVYIIIWLQNKRAPLSIKNVEVLIPLVTIIVLVGLIYVPFTTLSGNAEFQWGTTMLEESFKGLIHDSLQGRNYLGHETPGIIGAILLITIFSGLWMDLKNNDKLHHFALFHSSLLGVFILMVIAMVFSKWILGTLYPVERKATLYLPMIFVLVPYALDFWKSKRNSLLLGIGLSSLLIIHFFDKLELDRTREWYYDYQTKDYITEIIDQSHGIETLVGMHWTFFWSATYYVRYGNNDNIKLFRYNDGQKQIQAADYLIINDSEYPQFSEDYDIINGPNRSMVTLLRKKS